MSQKIIKDHNERNRMLGIYKMSLVDKAMSDRPTRKNEYAINRGKSTSESIP
jgi:hypothetical protein